jgi:hypothetical protein
MVTYVGEDRPGRNDPCSCGSGKKYKECCEAEDDTKASAARRRAASIQHYSYDEISPEVEALRQKAEARQAVVRRRLAEEYGVLINFVAPVQQGGGKVWCIGNRVYTGAPPNQTFHEFILQRLREVLGEDWRGTQSAAEAGKEHYLYRCFREYNAWTAKVSAETEANEDRLWSGHPNGWAQYLRSVAWDVVSLLHATAAELPEDLVSRMRDPAAFQGARYEIAVAALFARLDCKIAFLDDKELQGKKHVEFIATHRTSGQEFAVEAKSRHRTGVINEEGEPDREDPLHGDRRSVRRLFKKALEKEVGGLPYFIFIDINAPVGLGAVGLEGEWQSQVQAWMDRFPPPTAEQPAAYNGLFVTNFSPQYDGEHVALGGEWLEVMPRFASTPFDVDLFGAIEYALERFDKVPEISVDGELL